MLAQQSLGSQSRWRKPAAPPASGVDSGPLQIQRGCSVGGPCDRGSFLAYIHPAPADSRAIRNRQTSNRIASGLHTPSVRNRVSEFSECCAARRWEQKQVPTILLLHGVNQRTRSQVSVLICLSFGELVRTTIVSLSPDPWNWRMRFLPTSAAASAPSRWCV